MPLNIKLVYIYGYAVMDNRLQVADNGQLKNQDLFCI